MKKLVIVLSIIVFIVLSQIVMFNNVYYSKEDRKLALIVENAINLISKGLVQDYTQEFTIPDIEVACIAGSVYSASASEITKEVFPEYKYSGYLEVRKNFGKGEGSSLLMLIRKDSLVPFFFPSSNSIRSEISIPEKIERLSNMEYCYKPINKKVTISIKNGKTSIWEKFYDVALITIK